jgi:hypothetical protein
MKIALSGACLLFLAITASLSASDPELTNYKSGISLTWGVGDGSDKGTAYMEEYLYHDKIISDRKIVYIRDTTAITMSHNDYNNVANHISDGATDTTRPFGYFRVIGANGLDGIANSGDEGVIRYRVDREGQRDAFEWTSYPKKPLFPAYSAPITFAQLTYQAGVPVVGSTGSSAGYQRGIVDDFGDEWHVIAVGDDDMSHEPNAKSELQSSDGKIFTFVVNPKAPAISVRATGNAQFYTTPPKAHLVGKIHPQTTYIQPGSGGVTFELRDIFGRPISYRINGGSWVNVGANTITLSHSDFTNGTNSLEYRSAGFEGNARTRTIVKNPLHPSLAENHGHYMWGDQTRLNKITARLNRAPYLSTWTFIRSNDNTLLNEWDANGMTPHRNPFFSASFLNRVPLPAPQLNTAFIGKVLGFNTVPTGKSKSWGQYAKEQLLNGIWTRIDPVGFERNQASGSSPSAEVTGAGYYQIGTLISSVIAYDILAGHYRSDQSSGGLSPIEDYFIRDVLATAVMQVNYAVLIRGGANQIGLWTGARAVGALMVATCLKEYSTPYYGTSGYGSTQTRYAWTPHPTFNPTWKEIHSTTPYQSATIPGTDKPSINYEDPALWRVGGIWGGPNLGYYSLMKRSFSIMLNVNARYSPLSKFPIIEQGMKNGALGLLTTIDNDPPTYHSQALLANPLLGELGPIASLAMKTRNEESGILREERLFGLLWYDDDIASPVAPPTVLAPTNAEVSITVTPP